MIISLILHRIGVSIAGGNQLYFLTLSFQKILVLFVLFFLFLFFLLSSQWFWQFIYPLDYQEEIMKVAEENSLDPYLILAIIYVESRFNPLVESRSGARGLMQIMPETGAWIAAHRGINNYSAEDLFDPVLNISFGGFYLARLLNIFEGDLTLALAAYNAGTGNVFKWVNSSLWDGSFAHKDTIPFPETREYLEKVFSIYQRYDQIYGSSKRDYIQEWIG